MTFRFKKGSGPLQGWNLHRVPGHQIVSRKRLLKSDPLGARHAVCYALCWPLSAAAWGLLLCPASFIIGGTSGSETKLCQPFSSQSKITQTWSSWLGSRETGAPFDPCCLRF